MARIDFNCDLGEGAGFDVALMPWISSANVACGGHAGDAVTMAETAKLAEKHGVAMGAHPGFADRAHFGRRELDLAAAEIRILVRDQILDLATHGVVRYVKPHGALYNLAARDPVVASAVAAGVADVDAGLVLLGLAGSFLIDAGGAAGLRTTSEGFADRGYDAAGRLVPRGVAGALIEDPRMAAEQVIAMVQDGRVRSVTGEWIPMRVDSICLHGDNPRAVEFARELRSALVNAGVVIKSFVL